MDIGYIWDEKKYQQVRKKHHVMFHEVVSAFEDPNGIHDVDPQGSSDRWVWVGCTVSGRIMAIIYSDDSLPLYRIITAFKAEGRLLDEYHKRGI